MHSACRRFDLLAESVLVPGAASRTGTRQLLWGLYQGGTNHAAETVFGATVLGVVLFATVPAAGHGHHEPG